MSKTKSKSPRPFLVRDIIVLVAATAAGLGLIRSYFINNEPDFENPQTKIRIILNYIDSLTLLLASLSTATFVLRLAPPRPSLRRVGHQPGWTASAVVVIVTALGVIERVFVNLVMYLRTEPSERHRFYFDWTDELNRVMGKQMVMSSLAVAAIWAIQYLGRRWRPERSWLDRLGRLLGLLWIVVYWSALLIEPDGFLIIRP
ncbi:MAG TPA: hypothetical protein VG406_07700 [Isosphaeraceae bacterium]|jgi:hypothetical protein|nr:hypothetical protein [Isosphaeraceae bacterium]